METVRMLSTLGLMGAMRSLSTAFETATGVRVDAEVVVEEPQRRSEFVVRAEPTVDVDR